VGTILAGRQADFTRLFWSYSLMLSKSLSFSVSLSSYSFNALQEMWKTESPTVSRDRLILYLLHNMINKVSLKRMEGEWTKMR
jgi:hypothetical protein